MNSFEELEWMERGNCKKVNPEIFFPEAGHPNKHAKMICATCPVKSECLEYALQLVGWDVIGVWGGTSGKERRNIRRQRLEQESLEMKETA